MAETLQNARKYIGRRRSGKENVLIWLTSLKTAIATEGFLRQHGSDLTALVLETLPTCQLRVQQRAVNQLVKAALADDNFLRVFGSELVKTSAFRQPPQNALRLLEWVCLVLSCLPEDSTKAVQKLLEALSSLLSILFSEYSSQTGQRRWRAAQRIALGLFCSRPYLLIPAVELATNINSPGLLRVTLEATLKQQGSQQQCKGPVPGEKFLQAFCDNILAARVAPTSVQLAAYSPLLSRGLTLEHLADRIVPAFGKAIRRTPEPAITALVGVMQYVQLDVSGVAVDLVDLLLQQLRAKEAVRQVATQALSAVSMRVQDSQVSLQLIQRVTRVLDGSAEGKVKAAAERSALTAALAALAHISVSQQQMGQVATAAASFCSTYYKEEAVEEVKVALMSCLARWLPLCGSDGCPAAVVSQLTSGLKDAKDSLRRACLAAAVAGAQASPTVATDLAPLAAPLAKMAAEGCAKAVARGMGISASLAAALIATHSAEAGGVLDQAGFWSGPLAATSPLLTTANLAKVSVDEAAHAAQLTATVLGKQANKLVADSVITLSRLLTLCLLHHAAEVRRAAAAGCQQVLCAEPCLFSSLLSALRHWANHSHEAAVLVTPDESVSPAVGTYSHRFQTAILALLPSEHGSAAATVCAAALSGSGLSELLLMCHHPAITAGVAKKRATWETATTRLQGCVVTTLKSDAPTVLQALFGSSGVGSSYPGDVVSAQLALGSVMRCAPGACLEPLLSGLAAWLARGAHDVLSDEDIAVYRTPEGLLSSEVVPEGVYVPEVVVSKNVRKARGRMRSDNRAFATADDDVDDHDESPVATVKAAAARPSAAAGGRGGAKGAAAGGGGATGKGHKDAASRQAEFRARKLREESEVRSRVAGLKSQLDTGLAALQAAVDGNSSFASHHLREFSDLCQPLLASPISGDAAFSAVRSLARCMPPPLGGRSLLLAGCLRLVSLASHGSDGVDYASMPQRSVVVDVIGALYQSTVPLRRSLPGPSYALVFPVLAAVLHCPLITPLHDQALSVLALHVAPEQDVPCGASLTLLYHLLSIIPAYRDRVQPLLHSLCCGVGDGELLSAVSGLLSGSAGVRAAALLALPAVPTLAEGVPPASDDVLAVMALARHDADEDNAAAAQTLWDQAGCSLDAPIIPLLVHHLTSAQKDTRTAAAAALADALQQHPDATASALTAVLHLFGGEGDDDAVQGDVAASILLDEHEQQRRAAARSALISCRLGVAAGLECLSSVVGGGEVHTALDFLVKRGLAEPCAEVREAMVGAGVALVEAHGEVLAQQLLPQFESYLDPAAAVRLSADEARYDLVREGVVVLLGMMAGHLQPGDSKRRSIISMLLDVLSTPSEAVQRAVSNCLPRLVQPLSEDKPYMEALLGQLISGLKEGGAGGYGLRRGSAYGLSGVVKGLGIASFKGYGILERLKTMVEDKKDADGREGSLQAFECLCEKLGRLFEPYVIHILPLLLQCFGDPSPQVRAAADDAARSIMGQLSASGVKLVLPALLKGLEDSAWRTKQGSIQLLGAMAHCAPKQLGSCLPTIVPRLGGVLGDAHPRVQQAAKEALQEVGSVIRSPEMSALVPVLLSAIADPNTSTRPCLDTLLSTTFVNTIDAPSLALVVPVVHRGLRDRSGDTKKRAARIVGNMCSLTTPKDMTPYVSLLMPELQKALLDPLPEVRATAARAMGSLLKGMGPAALGDLLPWLLTTLRSEGSSVERSGAAQGLAEVVAVMGEAHLAELLPELCASATSKNPYVREGHLTLFKYLPLTMETAFQAHLGEVLPLILDGLSDEVEGVRDAALAAGRCFVDAYARSCLPLLLPAVEAGLDGDNWRIRQSSLELCGELLFKVAGTSGKVKVDGGSDDEGAACETYGAAIREALGRDRNAEVLSKLYVARSDVQYVVRNTALHIWKTIVVNTPRTLQEILPALMAEVISALADPGDDRRAGAARCLGELVRKMGERVLHRMLPILRDGMSSSDSATRQGVCAGLKEVLENVTRHQLTDHLAEILPPIQEALCDGDAAVREAAGAAFGVLFKGGAHGAVESVVPSLLTGLDSAAHASQSLEGLRVILGVRPQVFNGIVPKLLKQPVSSAGLRALGQLAATAAPVLLHHIPAIMTTCLALASHHSPAQSDHSRQQDVQQAVAHVNGGSGDVHDPRETAAAEAALAVALAADEDSLHVLVSELLKALEDVSGRARGAAELLSDYARASRQDLQPHVDELMTSLVLLLAEDDDDLVLKSWRACEAVAATIPKEDQASHVLAFKEAVAGAKEKERRKRRGGVLQLRGLLLPNKALAPFVPIYLQGVLQGSSPEVREAAAEGLGELISLTSEDGLKPFVVSITGPLIRIIGDRFPPATKAAILVTLGLLIKRAGAGLKPFVPQLQTTFLKCLNDQAPAVRLTAADNLGELTRLSARVEQLVSDLAANAASATDQDVAAAYLTALRGALRSSGDRLSPATLDKVEAQLLELFRTVCGRPSGTSGVVDPLSAALVTAMSQYCAAAGASGLSRVLAAGPLAAAGSSGSTEARELSAMLLAAVAAAAADLLDAAGLLRGAVEAAVRATRDQLASVKIAGGRAVARLYQSARNMGPAFSSSMTTLLGPDQSSEVQRQALVSLSKLAGVDDSALQPHLAALLPSICSILQRDPNSQVRSAAEQLLKRALQLNTADATLESGQAAAAVAGGTAKTFLTDAYLRRLSKLAEDEWVEQEEY